ncbi:MAG TPA: hypothetical protein PK734_04660 [Bacteroidales bacterium]|nr:hypothetical protein [Bacteroidales bacterium]
MHTEDSIHEAWGSVEIVPVWRWLVVGGWWSVSNFAGKLTKSLSIYN